MRKQLMASQQHVTTSFQFRGLCVVINMQKNSTVCVVPP